MGGSLKERSFLIREKHRKLLSEMKECYTVLIDGQCKAESLEDAKGLFREMLQEGLKPDVCDTQSFAREIAKDKDLYKRNEK